MKPRFFRRLAATSAVYVVVLFGIVLFQFSSRTGFTANLGSAVVSGRYAGAAAAKAAVPPGAAPKPTDPRALAGPLAVYFAGLEFRLDAAAGFAGLAGDGQAVPRKPESMTLSADRLDVRLDDGSRLSIATAYVDGAESLAVSAELASGVTELRLPFLPQRAAKLDDLGKNRLQVALDDQTYTFYQASLNLEQRYVAIKRRAAAFSYGRVRPEAGFAVADFIVEPADDPAAFERSVQVWKDKAYAVWERAMAGTPSEDVVAVYVAESARRGLYRSAIATTPKAFVDGTARGYRTAPYFGRLDAGLRSLEAVEREGLSRLSRLVNERGQALFAEVDLVAYLSLRGSRALVDDAAAIAKALDPETVKPAAAVGLLEAWTDWKRFRPADDNPFDKLLDQARFVLSAMLVKTVDGAVFPAVDGQADLAFALRAGRALDRYGQAAEDPEWQQLGRSLILSALRQADAAAALPASLVLAEGAVPVAADQARLSAAAAFRVLAGDSPALPHAAALPENAAAGVWAWTVAEIVGAENAAGVLDISVRFPVGETHYLLLRGVKPFAKIQLYGIDYRTDPRFERYDSSGWAYAAEERTLMAKMKHKTEIEHIRIYF